VTGTRTLGTEGHSFRVARMYHPSHHVPSLAEAEEWFARVFGRTSHPMAEMHRGAPPSNGYPNDYSTFTPINDVLFDTIDPEKYVLLGVQRYPTVETPHLKGFGWYVPDCAAAYRALKEQGVEMVSQLDEKAEGDDPPTAATSPMPLFFTTPETAGLRYELMPPIPFPLDPRIQDGWRLPSAEEDSALGIDFASHHTVLTDRPARALKVVVDALGGEIIHRGRNELLGLTSTYVQLADSILEYGVPDDGTAAHLDWRTTAPHDTYHTITWKVADLDGAAKHLQAQGVGLRTRTDDAIVTEPGTALGVPWVFTTRLVIGDPRG